MPSNDAIRELLAERVGASGIGAAVGVIEPGGRCIVAYGTSGAPDGRPLNAETVFQIGSVTKVLTDGAPRSAAVQAQP